MIEPTKAQREAVVLLECVHRALALPSLYSTEALNWVRNELLFERHSTEENRVREAIVAYIDEELSERRTDHA